MLKTQPSVLENGWTRLFQMVDLPSVQVKKLPYGLWDGRVMRLIMSGFSSGLQILRRLVWITERSFEASSPVLYMRGQNDGTIWFVHGMR